MAATRLDLITGFLGAGKTTFIRRYMAYLKAQGQRCVVIENEFGEAGVDAAFLADTDVPVTELSGGCICCTAKLQCHDALAAWQGKVDRIIVEPSGLFNPPDILAMVASPTLPELSLGMVLAVVDPRTVDQLTGEARAVLRDELLPCGAVFLSHGDTTTPAQREAAAALARELTADPELPVLDTDTPMALLMQVGAAHRPGGRALADHRTLFQSTTLTLPSCSREAVMAGCRRLMAGEAGEVLRIKGYLPRQDSGWWCVNGVPGTLTVEPSDSGQPGLNIIGRQLKRRIIPSLFAEDQ